MKKVGVVSQIEEALINGENRAKLNEKYNKGTVTKVYNRLIKDGLIKDSDKIKKENSNNTSIKNNEKIIESLFKEAMLLIDEGEKYNINIIVTKKCETLKKNNSDILNPFKLYNDINKEGLINELKVKDKEFIINIIKKYFNYNKKMINQSEEELAKYICTEVEKNLNLGKCFK